MIKEAAKPAEPHILVKRAELEKEHKNLLERLHQLRQLLGYPPILTGKKRREIRDGE